MNKEFWLSIWENNEIPFHQARVNPFLVKSFPKLPVGPGDCVFVPLCGKSLDMLWLRQRGLEIIGVDWADKALEQFFVENDLPHSTDEVGSFTIWQSDGFKLFQGNFYHLEPPQTNSCSLIYDRASLIALPPEEQELYATHLTKLCPDQADILLVTLDSPTAKHQGPPYSVPEKRVRKLFGDDFSIAVLEQEESQSGETRQTSYLMKKASGS